MHILMTEKAGNILNVLPTIIHIREARCMKMSIFVNSGKKATFIIPAILLVFFMSFFLIARKEKNEEVSVLITNLKSIKPELSAKAEKRLTEIGKPAVEPLRKAYRKEVIALKYYETVKAFRTTFVKKKTPDPELVLKAILACNPLTTWRTESCSKKVITKKDSRQLLVYNIVRIQNSLYALGEKNAVDQGVINSILECMECNNANDHYLVQELMRFFKSAGRSSIRPLMEQQRKLESSSMKSDILRLFMLEVVDGKSTGILLNYLKDKDSRIREYAADMLGYTEEKIPQDTSPSMQIYPFREVRISRIEKLINPQVGKPPGHDAVDLDVSGAWDGLKAMKDEFAKAETTTPTDPRKMLVIYQKPFKDVRAVEPLIGALKDPDLKVRKAAIRSLGLIGDVRAVAPISQFIEVKWNVSSSWEFAGCQREAAIALGLLGDPRGTRPLIYHIKAYLSEENRYVDYCLVDSISSLGMMGGSEAADYLLKLLKNDKTNSLEVRKRIIVALGCIRERRAVVPLLEIMEQGVRDDEYYQKFYAEAAAFSLGLIGDKRALEPLKKVRLKSRDIDLKIINWAIGEIEKKNQTN